MTTAIIIIVLLILAAVAVVVWMRAQQAKRREGLQDRFGPEYDRAVDEHGDRKVAEKQLADTAARRDSIEVRPLEPAERTDQADRTIATERPQPVAGETGRDSVDLREDQPHRTT